MCLYLSFFCAGYIVSSSRHRMNGVGGLALLIQSERKVSHVEDRMEAFLQQTKVNRFQQVHGSM